MPEPGNNPETWTIVATAAIALIAFIAIWKYFNNKVGIAIGGFVAFVVLFFGSQFVHPLVIFLGVIIKQFQQ